MCVVCCASGEHSTGSDEFIMIANISHCCKIGGLTCVRPSKGNFLAFNAVVVVVI